jgi:hypothetical protein
LKMNMKGHGQIKLLFFKKIKSQSALYNFAT